MHDDPECTCLDCTQRRFDAEYRQPQQDLFGGHQSEPINFGYWGTIAALVAIAVTVVVLMFQCEGSG